MGQMCDVACREWACTPGSMGTGGTPTTTTDPATGMTGAARAAGLRLRPQRPELRVRRAAARARGGRASASACRRRRRAIRRGRSPARRSRQVCPNGADADSERHRPDHLLPDVHLPGVRADDAADDARRASARRPTCLCAKQTGTDPTSCCPTYECGPVKADGTCG